MWFLTEIENMYKLSIREQLNICDEQSIKVSHFQGSDNKYLGRGVSDKDGEYLIKRAKSIT